MVTNSIGFLQRENARLQVENETLNQEVTQMRGFMDILNSLTTTSDDLTTDEALLPLLRTTFTMMMNLLRAPEGALLLLDDEAQALEFVLVKGELAERLEGHRFPANEGIAGWVIAQQQPALVRDVRHDNRFSHTIDDAFKFRTQSIAAAPVIGNGKVLGVMEALNQPFDVPFSDLDVQHLHLICCYLGEILENVAQRQ